MRNNWRVKCVFLVALCSLLFSIPVKAIDNDFEVKGFHIDLRCEVMTMPALKTFAKELSEMGINTIIMEYEAAFPYQKHATISNKYAYSPEEVSSFVAYCASLGIDVIPLQNCFGHMEYILRHDRYAHLKEDRKEVSQVCPMKEDACAEVFEEIFSEMMELHPSKYFHIGGDETYLLGSCPVCAAKAEKEGKSKLFVDYVKRMCEIVEAKGKIPVLWADIILKYPEALNELPQNLVYVDWNYGWDRDRFGSLDNLLKLGVTLWGAPSIRSHPDNMYLTQWEKHFSNQKTFIPYARSENYKGMVMTSWSTSGTYGFSYDTSWEVIEMYPVRYVYPLSGFRILVAAFGESLSRKEPLDPENFVINYGQQRFGFTADEGRLLWEILQSPQEEIRMGKSTGGKNVEQVMAEAKALRRRMAGLSAKSNVNEFEHLRLMLDIRVHYLSFKELESRYQSNAFSRDKAPDMLKEAERMLTESSRLDQRFTELNSGFLHDDELKKLNLWRDEKLHIMHAALKRLAE